LAFRAVRLPGWSYKNQKHVQQKINVCSPSYSKPIRGVKVVCELAQAFVQMIRARNADALEPWLKEATESGVPELQTFATGLRRDQAALLAALTHEWSHDHVA
jgi:transposase